MNLLDIQETGISTAPTAPQTTFAPGLASETRAIKPMTPTGLRGGTINVKNGNSRAMAFILTATLIDSLSSLVSNTDKLVPVETKEKRSQSINCIEAIEGALETWSLNFDLPSAIQERAIEYKGAAKRFLLTRNSRRNPSK